MEVQVLINVFIICFIASSVNAAGEGDWGYDWSGTIKVTKWNDEYPICSKMRQSPIHIQTCTAKYDSNLGDITMTNYDKIENGVKFTIKNGGKGFVVAPSGFTSSTVPTIKDGGLPGTFQLAQYHFHWGAENDRGSEHVKDRESYPAELHLVHFNSKYPNISTALDKADGLAVLGVFIKVGKRNPTYENFLNMTKYDVTHKGNTSLATLFKLMELLPMDKSFYRYNGSLTTPGCQESVTWTVFDKYIEISQDQLDQFRKMKYRVGNATGDMVDTYRPPQPLHNRVVYANFKESSTNLISGNLALLVASAMFALSSFKI